MRYLPLVSQADILNIQNGNNEREIFKPVTFMRYIKRAFSELIQRWYIRIKDL
jgi:hypothetical protein